MGDTLPAAVREYLAATPEANAAGKVNLNIVAIGGTGAVSASVMSAALDAAASADGLTVQIGNGGATTGGGELETDQIPATDTNGDNEVDGSDVPQVGNDRITLYFSDNIVPTETTLEAMVRDILEVNNAPARLATGTPVVHAGGVGGDCDPDTVTVTLQSKLNAGDTISIVGGAKLGVPPDKRAVSGASVTVPATPADRKRPTVSVIMIADRATAEVMISEPEGEVLTEAEITPRKAASATDDLVVLSIDETSGTITFDRNLVAGDRITVASGAVEDDVGNKNLQRSFTAIAPHKSPRITSVLMSNLKHSAQMETQVPTVFTVANAPITIAAKGDGSAAGAVGNAWRFVFDVASIYSDQKALDIDVRVNSRDSAVFVRFNNGKAKYADLKAELEGNSAFDAMFEVKLPADTTTGVCGATANNDLSIVAATTHRQQQSAVPDADDATTTVGMTQVAIVVRFNGYVKTVDSSGLLADLLADTAKRGGDDVSVTTVSDALGITGTLDKADTSAPTTEFRYEAITPMAGMLPKVRDLVDTDAGHAGDDRAADSTPPIVGNLIDPVIAVATGYAMDTPPAAGRRDTVDEDKNGASQVRIGRSSSVKAP